ncbi:MAG: helical backbone metal receptor, partial [Chloroflexota bacterium]
MSDQNHDEVYYYASENMPTKSPRRVVSAVPSMTETLFALGLDNQIVGITEDCLYPEDKVAAKYKVGPIEALRVQDVVDLQPDVVIVNREDNTGADIAALEAAGLHV